MNKASTKEIFQHLTGCDSSFVPPLSERVDLAAYSEKISSRAVNFEAWDQSALVGLLAAYENHEEKTAFITNVSVLSGFAGRGIAAQLLDNCVSWAKQEKLETLTLEVNSKNLPAVGFYSKHGFSKSGDDENTVWKMNYKIL